MHSEEDRIPTFEWVLSMLFDTWIGDADYCRTTRHRQILFLLFFCRNEVNFTFRTACLSPWAQWSLYCRCISSSTILFNILIDPLAKTRSHLDRPPDGPPCTCLPMMCCCMRVQTALNAAESWALISNGTCTTPNWYYRTSSAHARNETTVSLAGRVLSTTKGNVYLGVELCTDPTFSIGTNHLLRRCKVAPLSVQKMAADNELSR